MTKILSILIFLGIYSTSFSQWQIRNNGLPGEWGLVSALDAIDEQTAIVALANSLYITTDSGNRWEMINTPEEMVGETIIDLTAVDLDHIWICTQRDDPLAANIYATQNGGAIWVKQFDNPLLTDFFNYIEMFDPMNGVAMGDHPFSQPGSPALFLKTSDGGANWISMNQSYFQGVWSGQLWARIDFVSPLVGYFFESGINPQKLFKTVDGGINWTETNFSGYAAVIKFYDESIGAAVNSTGKIFVTTDGGENWREAELPGGTWPDDVEFSPGNHSKIWVLTGSKLFYSSDTGYTWNETFVSYLLDGIDMEFVDENHGWLISKDNLFYTLNGSTVVSSVVDENLPDEFVLHQNYPNPFNPNTKIKFIIPAQMGSTGIATRLSVYNILGKEVNVIVNSSLSPGTYEIEFNGRTKDDMPLSSGIYFYKLTAGNYSVTKKMTLIK